MISEDFAQLLGETVAECEKELDSISDELSAESITSENDEIFELARRISRVSGRLLVVGGSLRKSR